MKELINLLKKRRKAAKKAKKVEERAAEKARKAAEKQLRKQKGDNLQDVKDEAPQKVLVDLQPART